MRFQSITIGLISAAILAPAMLHAQFSFKIGDKTVQMHSFASQGFAYSDANNFLTMKTSNGSGAFTDGGINLSTSLTDKFRVGAQAYSRNIGQLGRGRVEIDWAYGDYRFRDWFGVRAGKVKTAFGLFNDTQDMEFLHTWAIMPQSLYPIDLRANMIAHTGGDIYGTASLGRAGSVSYTAFAGTRPDDKRGGYRYNADDVGTPFKEFNAWLAGGDARWNTPVEGLMIGTSWSRSDYKLTGNLLAAGNIPFEVTPSKFHTTAAYTDFTKGRLRLNAEFRRTTQLLNTTYSGLVSSSDASDKGWFASAAFRVTKRLELGTYHSRYYIDVPQAAGDANNHIFDQTVTARFDVARYWNVKVEGHFMDGIGDTYSAHGFYLRSNPTGLKPRTNLLVLRTGWNF